MDVPMEQKRDPYRKMFAITPVCPLSNLSLALIIIQYIDDDKNRTFPYPELGNLGTYY